ncbi:Basic secretory protease (Fragments) [Linum grandiflorum]
MTLQTSISTICVLTILLPSLTITCQAGIFPVTYTVHNIANHTLGGARFNKQIGPQTAVITMAAATNFTWTIFNQTANHPTERKNITEITLFIDCDYGPILPAAHTKNTSIHIDANFLGNYTANLRRQYKGNIRREFVGIVYHQMAAVWQWNGKGEAPKGLLSGIAEFVRMAAHYGNSQKAHYAPRMVGMGPGRTDNWDEGYGVTAMFLDYCNNLKDGVFVAELNGKMKDGYSRGYFRELLGKSVDVLWQDYKSKYLLL